jgi:hypothetical protein
MCEKRSKYLLTGWVGVIRLTSSRGALATITVPREHKQNNKQT